MLSIATGPGEVISHLDTKCVQGKGMPFFKESMYHGNLYIKFEVEFPNKKSFTED